MALTAKTIRAQLNLIKPLMQGLSLDASRRAQDMVGELMEAKYRRSVIDRPHNFGNFDGAWLIPYDQRRQGVILYLHGGGYTCGGIDYAKGFASMLAAVTGARVFCAAYRLAPEHPYPTAIDDACEAYDYLLSKGYAHGRITLCGESAGGGLCYALCLKLKELGRPQPCGVIAISPWTDLTLSGSSFETNADSDPSLTKEQLAFYANCYAGDTNDPMVSPLFGDLGGLPPSVIFAGGDELLLSDSERMHRALLSAGCQSRIIVAPQRWHGYLLYGLEEDRKDMRSLCRFLDVFMGRELKQRWLRLDNAAKIYPAARRQNWSNLFRVSATLNEPVDAPTLQAALDVTLRRFPSIAARLRRGVFWYYLEQIDHVPALKEENSWPLTWMDDKELRRCALRVIVYDRRIAVELFHSLTDGTGAMIFLKTLVAEYLHQHYNLHIPAEKGVLGRLEEPSEAELEDSFQKYAGAISAGRSERTAWHLDGTPEPAGFKNLTCFSLPVRAIIAKAHEHNMSLTAFLAAVMMQALQQLQKELVPDIRRRKPIKVQIPVNLRKLFDSRTLRNFALYTTPEILPRLGEYSFEEICAAVKNQMGLEINPKVMSMKIAANVGSERLMAVRLMPLFIKNIVMKAVFDSVGDKKSCITLSNLGAVDLPEVMRPYIERFDFILGTGPVGVYNCGVLSYGDTLYINFTRSIREAGLERHFFAVLRDMGMDVTVESNQPR